MTQQRTLAQRVTCTGLGLHTGQPVRLSLSPARVNTGIRFIRQTDGVEYETPVIAGSVSATHHATTLGCGDASVSTVEHLLASLHGLQIHNAIVGVDGPEVPVMDGSAEAFVHLIETAGVYEQHEVQPVMRIDRKVEFRSEGRSISIEPARHFQISYRVDFKHPTIGVQQIEIDRLSPAIFQEEIARARTFGFLEEVEALHRAGLGLGGSLGNTVVLDRNGVMNPGGLRFGDEFVRHKVLDLMGDLALLGAPVVGRVRVDRGGHALHYGLVLEVLAQSSSWTMVGETARGVKKTTVPNSGVPGP